MTTEIRNQFIKDIKLAINDEYVEKFHIRELDSKPNDKEKYKFLTEIYHHYFLIILLEIICQSAITNYEKENVL